MSRILPTAACAALLLAGCFSESRSPSGPVYEGKDTSTVNPNGTRKPNAPRVSYRTRDSLVFLDILGTGTGNMDWYWIYRDDSLLRQPVYMGHESGEFHYFLADTLHDSGTYSYTVRYGYRVTDLGPKSPAFVYAYPGRSPSGSITLSPESDQTVSIRIGLPANTAAGLARFERRVGPSGSIERLDTIPMSSRNQAYYRDTAFVPYDTLLYYRASILDAASEEWLAPTAWDSLRVFNRTWNYVPDVAYQALGTRVRADIYNPLNPLRDGQAFYFLVRGRSEARADGVRCDSLPAPATRGLEDAPGDTGTWYYWVEARDSHGRISPRSVPAAVRFTGIAPGPGILRFSVLASAILIFAEPYDNAKGYVLQRASDTARSPEAVDTLAASADSRDLYFVDAPSDNGYWFYRVLALADSGTSAPGAWSRADYFRRQESYGPLEVPIRNLGPRGVRAEMPVSTAPLAVLFRGRQPDGADSAAVDTLPAESAIRILEDMPAKGIWYYRIYRYENPSEFGYTLSRTPWVRIDYTGKAVGPSIVRLDKLGTGINVVFTADPDAIAYIVERSPDGAEDWTVIDTLSVSGSTYPVHADHPPRDGNWHYRARTIGPDLAATDPGPALGTGTPWVFRVTYDNSLVSYIHNRGDRVECPLTTSASFGYYLRRSAASDYSDPVLADSSLIGDPDSRLTDVPPKGIWYYWVERMIPAGTNSASILRSAPMRVEFTGAPEAIGLSRVEDGIRIEYPRPEPGDTLEIWRSAGPAADSASFTRVRRDPGGASAGYWIDPTPAPDQAAFYHYRLALRNADRFTGPGPIRTFYYVPQ